MPAIARPLATDYAPYYGTYVSQVSEGDVLAVLAGQIDDTVALLRAVPRARWTHRYAPGKWSVSEVVGHLADTERIFAYRALRFARNDATPLAGFDENQYVPPANFDARPLPELAEDLRAVRLASVALFRGLDDAALARRGTANQVAFTVRAIPWIIAGHERHHVAVLKERYL
jgi:hypothetical protein